MKYGQGDSFFSLRHVTKKKQKKKNTVLSDFSHSSPLLYFCELSSSLCLSFLACVASKCLSEPLTRDKRFLVLVQTTFVKKGGIA